MWKKGRRCSLLRVDFFKVTWVVRDLRIRMGQDDARRGPAFYGRNRMLKYIYMYYYLSY
jgi:hypothetical protein